MSNTLQSVHPELVSEWSDKNLPLTSDKITFGSNKRVWWKGSCGHEWQASVKARSGGEKCPICSGARVVAGINDLATLEPLLVKQWSKKNKIKPTEVSIGSHKKVIWRCEKGHEWIATVKSRTINKTGCPYCSHNKVLAGFNDLATLFPEVADEWSDKNEKKPTEVTAFANSKAWWKCKICGYEWNTLISTRSGGSKCPCCSGYTFIKGKNDLKSTHPLIAKEWSEKNYPLQPDEVNAKSRKNVWWHCRKFDVKTGDTVWQAQQKCRDLVIVPPHYEEYIKYSKLARSLYERYTDQVEPYGMDECWLDITGTGSLFGSPVEVANKIRETIKFELGLTISVGVSFNKIFAKLGSDMKKPDAVTVIPKDTFREKIWKLPSADLLGVGRATQRTLDSYGIRTIGALAQTDPEFLRSVLGKNGVALWNYANGNDLSLVAKKDFVSPIKSVGHGITTVADLEKPEQVWPVFLELTQDIGHKLRVHGLSAEGVAIHIRDNTLCTKQWQTKIDLPTQSPMVLAKRAFQLFEARYGWYNPIRSVTIQAINLIPQDTPRQIGLFMDVEKQEKLERLEKCIETIRRRFGKDSIRNGVLYQDLQLPPEKVEITMPTGMVG